jgi:hypothetical protein
VSPVLGKPFCYPVESFAPSTWPNLLSLNLNDKSDPDKSGSVLYVCVLWEIVFNSSEKGHNSKG